MALAYLLDPQLQLSDKSGALSVAGFLRVYINGTDDRAVTYKDFNGTLNTADIVLDDNGRAVVIADSSKTYRLEVYNRLGGLMWTQYPLNTIVGGAGGADGIVVESTDGSIQVDKYNAGGLVHFDLSTEGAQELKWTRTDNALIEESAEGVFLLPVNQVEGNMTVDCTGILLKANVHYDVSMFINIEAPSTVVNRFEGLQFRVGGPDAPVAAVTFDNSYAHRQVACLSCDVHPRADTRLRVYVEGLANGAVLSCSQCTVHSLAASYTSGGGGGGGGGTYTAGNGINIDSENEISVDSSVVALKSDLSQYVTDSDLETILEGYATTEALSSAISGIRQVPASTFLDASKVLTVDSNGDPVWAARRSGLPSYSASDAEKSLVVDSYGALDWAYRLPGQVFVIPENVISKYNNIPGWSWTSFRASIDANVASGTPMMVVRQSDSNHPSGETAFYYHATHDSQLSANEWVYVFGTVIAKDKYNFDETYGGPRDVPMPGQVTYTFYKYGEDNVRVSIENKPILYCPSMDAVQDGSVLIADIGTSTAALRWERRQDVPIVNVDYRFDRIQLEYVLSTDINTIWSSVVTEIIYGRTPALSVDFHGDSSGGQPYYGRHRFIVETTDIREDYYAYEYCGNVVFTANIYDRWNGTWSNYSGILSKPNVNDTPTLTWQTEPTTTIGTVTV